MAATPMGRAYRAATRTFEGVELMADSKPDKELILKFLDACKAKEHEVVCALSHPCGHTPIDELLGCIQLLRGAIQELLPRED
jgi:hypothetical protein